MCQETVFSYIYADNAATTRLSDLVFEAMLPWLREDYGNASALYKLGRNSHRAIGSARKEIAGCINAAPMEICFTSGGTESDNWALKGTMAIQKKQGRTHLITSAIEHHAILHTAGSLEKEGYQVTYLPVDREGRVDSEDVRKAIRPETGLVSIMYANNETGVIQPIAEIGSICREKHVVFHTDAVQAAGTLPIDVYKQKIDLLSMSAHKFNGPKGIGLLYCRKGAIPAALIEGGGQERGHRSGTENVAAIVGMAAALRQAQKEQEEKCRRLSAMRDRIQQEILSIDGAHLNGSVQHRLPGILNVSFDGIDGQSLLLEMDLRGIAVSSGSACNSGSMTPSHVLLAMGIPYVQAHGSLRISLGRYNREEECEAIISAVKESVHLLRTDAPRMNG